MPYLYETHLHTKYASACASARGRDYIRRYQDAGYAGLFVTDHFFHGNCAVDQRLPWREQVDWFCRGYEEAKEEGDKRGFQVFFGWEQNFECDEYLVYGLDKQWLYAHPEVKGWTRGEQHAQTRRYGGCVIQAHPFRDRAYIHRIHLSTGCVDGVEVYNAANPIEVNALGYRYAKHLGLPMLAGSDIHRVVGWDPEVISGVCFETPLRDEHDFAERVLRKEPIGLIAPTDELKAPRRLWISLPVEVRDQADRVTDTPVESLLS